MKSIQNLSELMVDLLRKISASEQQQLPSGQSTFTGLKKDFTRVQKNQRTEYRQD